MKTGLFFVIAAMIGGCRTGKDIQVKMVNAELVKIDTVRRFSFSEKVLTWQSADNIRYVSFEPMEKSYTVGSKVLVMVER